jgi:hypothetical protein
MIEIHPYAKSDLVAAALLLISNLSWAAAPKGLDQRCEGVVMHDPWGQSLREQPKPPLPAHRAWPSPLPKPNPFTLQVDLALAVPCLYPNLRSELDARPDA